MSNTPPSELITDRLLLRRLQASDADAIYRYASDPEVTRFMDWPQHESPTQAQEFLQLTESEWNAGEQHTWGIVRSVDNQLMGAVACSTISFKTSFGYVLARDSWGQGYATEAATRLVRWLSVEAGVARVWATCDVENTASARVLEKSGLKREARLECWVRSYNLPGRPLRDAYVYALCQR